MRVAPEAGGNFQLRPLGKTMIIGRRLCMRGGGAAMLLQAGLGYGCTVSTKQAERQLPVPPNVSECCAYKLTAWVEKLRSESEGLLSGSATCRWAGESNNHHGLGSSLIFCAGLGPARRCPKCSSGADILLSSSTFGPTLNHVPNIVQPSPVLLCVVVEGRGQCSVHTVLVLMSTHLLCMRNTISQ